MIVKIAVAGTHSTGKTTFIGLLRDQLETAGYRVATVSDLGEAALNLGFPILYDHTPKSTLWIMSRGISLELEAELNSDVVLIDRPVPDALGYYRAALAYRNHAAPQPWADYLLDLAAHHANTYNLIFQTELDLTIPLGTNKSRDPDGHYRALAAQGVSSVLTDLGLTWHPLTPDNHQEAVQFARDQVVQATAAMPSRHIPAEAPSPV